MDFSHVEFPCTVDLNTLNAYLDITKCKLPKIPGTDLHIYPATDSNDVVHTPKSLRLLVLDVMVDNWNVTPIYERVPRQEDRNYILSNLDVNLPLKIVSCHIRDDFFWRKCYRYRWKTLFYKEYTFQPYDTTKIRKNSATKPWINIYMERHLQEFIENVTTVEYEQESVQATLDICALYINQLEINYLQPSMDGQHGKHCKCTGPRTYVTIKHLFFNMLYNHIPLDFILSNLPELHTLRLTYCTKTIGMNFYLGCNTLSQRDALLLARGLSCCHELVNFCLHNAKLEPHHLRLFAHSLDKGCHHLTTLALQHCGLGDEGICQFLDACHKESFPTLKYLDLTNNKLSSEGAFILSRVIKDLSLETLILHLNPIGSDGAVAILPALQYLPIKVLDIGSCSLTDAITKLFMKLIIQGKNLIRIDLSNNFLGQDFGKHLLKVIGFNRNLKWIDLRNTGLTIEMHQQFKKLLK